MKSEENRANSFSNYIISFFICSIILWIYNMAENWVMLYAGGSGIKWILNGPYSPFAALEIMGVMGLFMLAVRLGESRDINPTPIFLVVMSVILFSVFEFFGSLIYETVRGSAPWDFGGRIMNINGRVCCERIVALTVIELAYLYVAQPFLNRVLNRIDIWIRYILALLFTVVILTDIICTFFV